MYVIMMSINNEQLDGSCKNDRHLIKINGIFLFLATEALLKDLFFLNLTCVNLYLYKFYIFES